VVNGLESFDLRSYLVHSDWAFYKPVVLYSRLDEFVQLVEHSDIANIFNVYKYYLFIWTALP